MTVEELREKIGDIIYEYNMFTVEELAVQILTLIKEADWKSPEEWNKNEIKWMNIVQGMREANGTV
jgi:hypothetical protein